MVEAIGPDGMSLIMCHVRLVILAPPPPSLPLFPRFSMFDRLTSDGAQLGGNILVSFETRIFAEKIFLCYFVTLYFI